MRPRFVISAFAVFLCACALLAAVLLGPSLYSSLGTVSNQGHPEAVKADTVMGNAIVRENSLAGTTAWKIPTGKAATTQIQAYANARSVKPGTSIVFFVSTQQEGTNYWVDIYRLGWYNGLGGRLMTSIPAQVGHAQGYYDVLSRHLVDCQVCIIDTTTGLIEANWASSYTLNVPGSWTTGIYLAKFTDANGLQTYVPFDVLGNTSSDYVVVTPDTTYAAYNDWGGFSLYDSDGTQFSESDKTLQSRAVKVSFDRPYTANDGSSQVLIFEADAIHWMERQGYDLSYMSNVDLQEDSAQLLHHKAYISIGHDEYWTKEMRDGVEQARNSGVGLAFLGANTGYWQMRFEPDSRAVADRTIVCYKVSSSINDLARDPYYTKDITRLTTQWRDPILARPENALVGIMYADLTHKVNGFPWQVDAAATSPFLSGTGLTPAEPYGCGLVGYEWDRVFSNGATPKNLQIIGTSTVQNDTGVREQSNTTYYVASSGALVFASGSIYWTYALDTYRAVEDKNCLNHDTVVPSMQKLMTAVMEALIIHQAVS